MRENPYLRYFIGFLVTIGLIILLIVLLFSGGGSKKGGNNSGQPSTSNRPKTISDLVALASTDAVMRLSVDGPIVADQNHQALRITVGKDDTTYEQIQGYQGNVVNQQSFANNQNAYSNFLYALGRTGFLIGDNSKILANEKGYCPTGNRYIFEIIESGNDIQRYWATNCSNSPRTYKGNLGLTLTLFRAQVPNYSTLTRGLSL